MTAPGPDDAVAAAFEDQRGRLLAIAQRMLGSRSDAEDAVQEAWLRLARQDAATIDNLGGWLTTVVGRVCVDVLRSRRARPETPVGDRLSEWTIAAEDGKDPADDVVLAESVGLALLVVLDTLKPAERLAFVLHDMFAVPFDEIAGILGRSTDATKMLASRARSRVRGTSSVALQSRQQRAVVDAFLAAARTGDFEGLLRVLDPDVTWTTYTARGAVVRLGAVAVAGRARRGAKATGTAQPVLINGQPGIVARGANGRVVSAMVCTVVDGRIAEMVSVADPVRLARMTLPDGPATAPPAES